MNIEQVAQAILDHVLEISHRPEESATERMAQIVNAGLRFYSMRLRAELESKTSLVVQYGPFSGMRYLTSAVLPRLIGSYEAELHDTIEELVGREYERVVNIGCGEGYYAVGLARLLPKAQIFALDSDINSQKLCLSLAELNGVASRVTVMGECTPGILRELAIPGTLVFCDCEGGELTLLDPVAVPAVSQCDMLVEMHDFLCPQTTSMLEARFRPTHDVRVIPQAQRNPPDYPILEPFSEFERLFALCEFRPGPTPWGLFFSKASGHGAGGG